LKAMAWDLRGNMDDEIDRAVAVLTNPEDVVEALHPPYDAQRHAPIVGGGRIVDGAFDARAKRPRPRGGAPGGADGPGAATARARVLVGAPGSPPAGLASRGRGQGLGPDARVAPRPRSATAPPLLPTAPRLGPGQPATWSKRAHICPQLI